MTIQEEINALSYRILQLKLLQKNCVHEWGDVKYDPRHVKKEEVVIGQYDVRGVDMWPRTTFVDVEIPRWTRVCLKCGFRQDTEEEVEIKQAVKKTPFFSEQR